jgi:hypothetical protein
MLHFALVLGEIVQEKVPSFSTLAERTLVSKLTTEFQVAGPPNVTIGASLFRSRDGAGSVGGELQ